MPSPPKRKKRRSLRPENFHLEIPEDEMYRMFKEANQDDPDKVKGHGAGIDLDKLSDADLSKQIAAYQKVAKASAKH